MAKLRVSFSNPKARYTEEVSFAGIDVSSPQMSVNASRALDACNYIYRDNSVQKRYGYLIRNIMKSFPYVVVDKTKYQIKTNKEYEDLRSQTRYTLSEDAPIYDIWSFHDMLIVHKGKLLFYIKDSELETGSLTPIAFKPVLWENVNTYAVYEFPEKSLSAFINNNKLWILTGEYLMELTEANDVITLYATTIFGKPYVPTTTIGITQSQSGVSGSRMTYESPNMLTKERLNCAVGGIENNDKDDLEFTFALDNASNKLHSVTINSTNWDYVISDYSKSKVFSDKNAKNGFTTNISMPNIPMNSNECFGILKQGNNIDFTNCKIVTKGGNIIPSASSFNTDNIPSAYVDESIGVAVPDLSTEASLKKYNEGEYYVRIFDLNSDTSGEMYPTNLYWVGSSFLTTHTYTLLIYYMEDGIVYYGSMDFKVVSSSATVNFSGNGISANLMDYIGNAFLKVSSSSCDTESTNDIRDNGYMPLYLISAFGYDLKIKRSTDINVYDTPNFFNRVGDYRFVTFRAQLITETVSFQIDAEALSVEATTSINSFEGNYYEDTMTLKPVALYSSSELNAYVSNSSILKELPTGEPIKTDEEGFYLVDTQNISADGTIDDDATIYGYVKYTDKTNKIFDSITLFISREGSYNGESNIEIDFDAFYETQTDYEDQINHCTFGHMFGSQNYNDRLFVSGNEDYPTYDWHSGGSDTVGELNYFPTDSVCKYGNDSAVAAYGVVSDGKMIVIKKPSDKETTVYYRTATYGAKTDDYGNTMTTNSGETLYEELYPRVISNSHIGALSQKLICDYCGDTIFVDGKKRIVGLDNEDTTYDNQRIASTRSSNIDKEITKLDNPIDNCLLVQDGDELFYGTPTCLWYSHYEAKYEWFRIGLKDIIAFAHIRTDNADKQVFGSKDGYLYILENNKFYDEHRIIVETGDIVGNVISPEINEYMLFKPYTFHIVSGYSELGKLKFSSNSNYVYIDSNLTIYENVPYYVDSCLSEFYFAPSDTTDIAQLDGYMIYEVVSKTLNEGATMTDTTSEISLYSTITNADMVLYADMINKRLYIDKELTKKAYIVECPYIYYQENIVAYYITAPYLTNDLSARKVMDQYTIVSDMGIQNEISLAIATDQYKLDKLMQPRVMTGKQVNYNDIAYSSIDYQRYTLPHTQNIKGTLYGQFVCLKFVSNSNANSTLTKMQFVYHHSGRTIGRN